MRSGKFITIEGIEGAGKSTVLFFVQDYLTKAHLPLLLTREPGGTDVAEEIRQILLKPKEVEAILPLTELLLMFASRAQHVHHRIQPALEKGTWVLSDRYVDASYAYQGAGRGIDQELIRLLDEWTVGDCYPDLTFLLDIPAEAGLDRAEKRGVPKDRIEQEKTDFFIRVRNHYLERAKKDPERIKLIDASLPLTDVKKQIRDQLDEFLLRAKQ